MSGDGKRGGASTSVLAPILDSTKNPDRCSMQPLALPPHADVSVQSQRGAIHSSYRQRVALPPFSMCYEAMRSIAGALRGVMVREFQAARFLIAMGVRRWILQKRYRA
jgi:hypothetical protein